MAIRWCKNLINCRITMKKIIYTLIGTKINVIWSNHIYMEDEGKQLAQK